MQIVPMILAEKVPDKPSVSGVGLPEFVDGYFST